MPYGEVEVHGKVYKVRGNTLVLKLKHIQEITEILGLEHLTGLKRLDLSYNHISRITGLDNLTNLEKLDLSNNDLESIDGLENLVSLRSLKLKRNPVEKDVSHAFGTRSIGTVQNPERLVDYCRQKKGMPTLYDLPEKPLVLKKKLGKQIASQFMFMLLGVLFLFQASLYSRFSSKIWLFYILLGALVVSTATTTIIKKFIDLRKSNPLSCYRCGESLAGSGPWREVNACPDCYLVYKKRMGILWLMDIVPMAITIALLFFRGQTQQLFFIIVIPFALGIGFVYFAFGLRHGLALLRGKGDNFLGRIYIKDLGLNVLFHAMIWILVLLLPWI
ncbi:MAG: leucine-rich repeat domain-containing protein [Candidatus Hodarchaeota archaeon]